MGGSARPRLLGVTAAKETRDGDGREDMGEQREDETPVAGAKGRVGHWCATTAQARREAACPSTTPSQLPWPSLGPSLFALEAPARHEAAQKQQRNLMVRENSDRMPHSRPTNLHRDFLC